MRFTTFDVNTTRHEWVGICEQVQAGAGKKVNRSKKINKYPYLGINNMITTPKTLWVCRYCGTLMKNKKQFCSKDCKKEFKKEWV